MTLAKVWAWLSFIRGATRGTPRGSIVAQSQASLVSAVGEGRLGRLARTGENVFVDRKKIHSDASIEGMKICRLVVRTNSGLCTGAATDV
jgi:hypothetical protein